jgi:hypothetical protein
LSTFVVFVENWKDFQLGASLCQSRKEDDGESDHKQDLHILLPVRQGKRGELLIGIGLVVSALFILSYRIVSYPRRRQNVTVMIFLVSFPHS